jgi:hypothetical protein
MRPLFSGWLQAGKERSNDRIHQRIRRPLSPMPESTKSLPPLLSAQTAKGPHPSAIDRSLPAGETAKPQRMRVLCPAGLPAFLPNGRTPMRAYAIFWRG